MVSSGLLQQVLISGRVQLWDPQQEDVSHYLGSGRVETFSQRSSLLSENIDRPQEPGVLYDSQETQLLPSLLNFVSCPLWLFSLLPLWLLYRKT